MSRTVFDRAHPNPALVSASLSGSVLSPFWLEGLALQKRPVFTGEQSFDLVVVGGGYTGL